jgi:iron-sulfur cluster insertion protein
MLQFPFEITPAAQLRVTSLLEKEPEGTILRLYIEGGGCSGYKYQFVFDEIKEDDYLFYANAAPRVAVDPISAALLEGAQLDFEESLSGDSFVVNNPKAKSTCGCGSSFGA